MKSALRWGTVYIVLMVGLTALGHYNQQQSARLQALLRREADLRQREVRLNLERYQLTSPLALLEWAEAQGYIPMSLGRWAEGGRIP
ncbi:MAG: hypothetical protein NZ849_06205 [Meiothermus sp.]|uniref:hypothetical protein n=1 Tax=Meiothermus sp. TaxID=1955249 RepID=UPI0025F0C6C6|nr:hypothetical protein [Meiothermus sp.]MCS7059523.1 hypothetical protein [Meiothermus sp.]MCS7194491.1 hypothetical protein [Meiothermus sp.]MDW8091585.1 hypothetical protein [Meiothermus sp.]MDW8482305.1 hypothetical protein [Meiothermus sp.]